MVATWTEYQEEAAAFFRSLGFDAQTNISVPGVRTTHDIDVLAGEAKTILCLNRELICHVAAQDFITSDHLTKLYGEKGKFILHKH